MPQRITESLVRKRAEHNNMEISTLEELSLHQLDIEKIEHLDKWCRDLKILYLQGNLISRIENVGRLKKLEYLNLALNNVTTIEKLEGCESLQKLDLTVNFVGDLLSVEQLRENCHLRELFLTGNPCTKYEGYREYVVVAVPQLRSLDGTEITRTERLQASQNFKGLRERIAEQQEEYFQKREEEKAEREAKKRAKVEKKKKAAKTPGFDGRWYTDMDSHVKSSDACDGQGGGEDCSRSKEGAATSKPANGNGTPSGDEDSDDSLDDEVEGYTPESRLATHRYMEKKRNETGKKPDVPEPKVHKKPTTLFREGKPVNVNEGRYDFSLTEDEEANQFVLDLACPRFMDPSLMEVDVQPLYVRVTLKGKHFQLALMEEVSPDSSTAKRSQTTGHLVVTMPKAKQLVKARRPPSEQKQKQKVPEQALPPPPQPEGRSKSSSSNELLEIVPSSSKMAALSNIVTKEKVLPVEKTEPQEEHNAGSLASHDPNFVDDPDVPPLI